MNSRLVFAWIEAFRLRTLPLAMASILMGSFLAVYYQIFRWDVLVLALLTTVFLQILSNLANDYGDFVNGADSLDREGPSRAVQSGQILPAAMKRGIYILSILSLISGVALILIAFRNQWQELLIFFTLGLSAIWAAIRYTAGDNPYGYKGFGDLFVLLFFGLVGVGGTFYLYGTQWHWEVLLPALSCGFFATAVLNVNNIRDINADQKAGKKSIPVRLGKKKATYYHWSLLLLGNMAALIFTITTYSGLTQFAFLLALPLMFFNGWQVSRNLTPIELDPYLKQMAITTLLFVLLFGFGLIWA